MSKKIKILGAGLSGLTSAIVLAKAGYEVEIFEKNADCGARFHGDMQGLENWSANQDVTEELNSYGLDINFDCAPFKKLSVSNGKDDVNFDFDRPIFYLVKRGTILGSVDQGLKQQAIEAGVKINFSSTIEPAEADIVATGPGSGKAPGAVQGITFKTDLPNMAATLVGNKYAFFGYSYLLVVDGYACICCCVLNKTEKLPECFEETKKYFVEKYKLEINDGKPAGGIGHFSLNNVWKKDKTMFVGEAAGIQDFLAGFGMRTAVSSGYLAAQAIINDRDYVELAENKYRNYLKAGVANRYRWETTKLHKHLDKIKYLKNLFRSTKRIESLYNFNFLQRFHYRRALSYVKKNYPEIF